MNRAIIAHTPADSGELLFKSLTGQEGLSEAFEFEVELLNKSNNLNLRNLLGKSLTVELRGKPLTPRFLNGYITRMTLTGRETSGERYYIYRATVRPGLWYLTQNRDFRIWQEKSVPDIIASVLSSYQIKFENKLTWDYRQWGYCVQYQESDFDFISRLMEHEGIYYYFIHERDSHTLVLADAPQAHEALPGYGFIPYQPVDSGQHKNTESVHSWSVSDIITPSLYSLDDYDFRKPRARLLETRQNPNSFAVDKAEVFDWPGRFTDREHGQFYVRVRQEEFEARHEQMSGEGSSLGFAPGHTFVLTQAPRMEDNREYLTTHVKYFLTENAYSSSAQSMAEHILEFSVIPNSVSWRPPRVTQWPKTHGPQTAEVVGPEGQPIWTDKYGRVKLKFRWDRHSTGDDTSSCWVRVSSAWAGWKYGGVQIPRVGEEVVVDFINGDPDRPMITGRVYNENNMPPWDLPNDATKMGFMSRSTNGSPDNASYLFFEDSPGNESFDMHAEKDMNVSVEGDQFVTIDGTRTTVIGGKQDDSITDAATFHFKSSRTTTTDGLETVNFNNHLDMTVNNGRKMVITGGDEIEITGDQTFTLKGAQTQTIDDTQHVTIKNNQMLDITDGSQTNHIKSGQITTIMSGGQETTVTAGGQTTLIEAGGQTLTVNAGGQTSTITGDVLETYNNDQTTEITGTLNIHAADVSITSDTGVSISSPSWTDNCKALRWSATGFNLSFNGMSLGINGLNVRHTTADISHSPISINKTNVKISNTPMNYTQTAALLTNGALRYSSMALAIFV
ncbi:type VI secretion system Vgr family protein [Enterobacillus tribolii]|uniref:Type VI secretion system secreted protein VgrG n=1 Tax=Enterobacillus tribolii TaxID=1487935 RepID=A0A370Q6X6_9GAMM|nr:type VI secretion system tip protein TssI/VgrG [Enterobacillus tribolii]MBW7984899.1 type VI secretion system tip protein VgrG [Enterobacillus tribolii]RDK84111.1 type VI secretion system secreted protein VgrG [Enterobacillus tribolii]